MKIHLAESNVAAACERVLRTLPRWFGQEASIRQWAQETEVRPTFVIESEESIVGFLSLKRHFDLAAEVSLIAVDHGFRKRGLGRALLGHAEDWLRNEGCRVLQIKTLPESHPSPEFAETRAFYRRMGYLPLEVLPSLPAWSTADPCLVLVKFLPARPASAEPAG